MKSRGYGASLRRRVSWRTLLIGPKLANMMPRDQDKKLRNRFSRRALLIGAGQAGLSVGYHLAQRQARFVILDAHARVGDAWRQRWDSRAPRPVAWIKQTEQVARQWYRQQPR